MRSLGLTVVSAAKQISIHSLFIERGEGGLGVNRFFWAVPAAKQISTPWEKGKLIMAA
jgi:hypothetical protein